MRIDQDSTKSQYQIKAFEPGRIKINDTWYDHNLIVGSQTLEEWSPPTIAQLNRDDFNKIVQLQPKILLLGTGNKMIMPSSQVFANLVEYNIGVEVMTSLAACRTFEALMSEDRNALAAIMLE
jgi:uncharacterized protein